MKREESIIVSGAVGRDCNGTYIREPTPRNGKACYSRGSCGAIYFDGIYWKICQVGVGLDETGWNYSQRPSELSSATPPLGCWESGRNISGEMAVDYTDLSLSSSVFFFFNLNCQSFLFLFFFPFLNFVNFFLSFLSFYYYYLSHDEHVCAKSSLL